MNVKLHIERLIVEDLAVAAHQGRSLQLAVETELTRLLSAEGLANGFGSQGSVPQLRAPTIQLTPGGNTRQLGQEIARSVYQGLNSAE